MNTNTDEQTFTRWVTVGLVIAALAIMGTVLKCEAMTQESVKACIAAGHQPIECRAAFMGGVNR